MVREAFRGVTADNVDFEGELRRRALSASEGGGMAIAGVVEGLVEAGQSAVREAGVAKAAKERQANARPIGKCATPEQSGIKHGGAVCVTRCA